MSRRGRGEGTIIADTERGGFRAALSLGWLNGKRKRRVIRGATQAEVIEQLDKAKAEFRKAQQLGLPPDLDKQSVSEYLHHWLDEVVKPRLTPKTHQSYAYQVERHILPSLGEIQLSKLRPQHVRALIGDKLNSGLSGRSVQYIHAILRSALGTALQDDAVWLNVAERAKGPRPQKKEVEPLTPEQAITLLDAVSAHRLKALYTVGTALGMRQGEQLGLRWQYIDLDAGTLRVEWALQRISRPLADGSKRVELHLVPPKQHSRRTVDLPQITIEALRAHRESQREERILCGSKWHSEIAVYCERKLIEVDDFVFTTPIGTPLESCNLNKQFQQILKACGLPKHRFHDLRHTAATLLTVMGVQPKTIMKILGWSQMSMVDRYTHLVDEMRQEAAGKMNEILTRKPAPETNTPNPVVSRLVSRGGLRRVK
ncbi:MAG: tyrosine-type recombinase/integrase [Bryobacteraceae bacterium]